MAVFADSISAPYTKYPGGVIALRAYDWLGPARATLTTEADSRSPVGTVVRDSQKVTTSIKNDFIGAFVEADDTFTLDFADLPLEADMFYVPVFSFLVEGDWGTANDIGASMHDDFGGHITDSGGYGDTYRPLETQKASSLLICPRKFDQFMIQQSNVGFQAYSGTNVYHFRFYAQAGTTIEFLFDQIWLFPDGSYGSNPQWGWPDFTWIPGSIPDYSVWYPWIDGADGGDSFGKFTINPYLNDTNWDSGDWSPWVGDAGGNDYQKKSSSAGAEYWARLLPDDSYVLRDSTKPIFTPESEPKASHFYGVHGAFYWPTQTIVDDHFSRTLYDGDFDGPDGHFGGSNWGDTPEGFGWGTGASGDQPAGPVTSATFGFRYGSALWVDGSRANMRIKREFQGDYAQLTCTLRGQGTNPNKPGIMIDSADYSGKVFLDYVVVAGSSPTIWLSISSRWSLSFTPPIELLIDVYNKSYTINSTGTTVAGPVDMSSWWNGQSEIGWRIRQDRFRIRVKIWDASGAEPASWDYDGFTYVAGVAYPYGDDPFTAWNKQATGLTVYLLVGGVTFESGGGGILASWDDVVARHELGSGTISPTHFSVEHPDGTEIDSISVPVGAQRVVFWGTKDWTDYYVPYDESYVVFSQKQWSETSAPPLQAATTPWWYLRSKHKGASPQIIRYRA